MRRLYAKTEDGQTETLNPDEPYPVPLHWTWLEALENSGYLQVDKPPEQLGPKEMCLFDDGPDLPEGVLPAEFGG